ncbi:MAG: ISNCY family transposase [Candidatus Omnitrophica bacterium]|nr:ISNCY family transposase [Candidatus Omnitrophota bacterium]
MAVEEILTMSQKELKRLHVIRKAIEKGITQQGAAELLEIGERQVRRIIQRVRIEADKGVIHRSRGKVSHRATSRAIKNKILGFCRGVYSGFNPTFASEKLFERNKITISRETLRQWFITEGIRYEKRKARPHRQWRERKRYYGEMIQMDGSHHDWFEGRSQPCVLMGYIDDATSKVYARFYTYEGTIPAMDSFKRYIVKYGIPVSIYLDRHAAYKSKGKATLEEELSGREPMSEFERALDDLGIRVIFAQSAPAKGRIERLFKTFQDRLIKEMRLRRIKSIPEGNTFLRMYLPVFNKRFGVLAAEDENLHRQIPVGIDLDGVFSLRTPRVLRNDFTVVHGGKMYQIQDTIRTDKVIVEERLNGALVITHKGKVLRYRQTAQRPTKEKRQVEVIKAPIQPKDNPWRHFRLPGSHPAKKEEGVFAGAL